MNNPCTDCGIKGLYEECAEKCIMMKKYKLYKQGRADAIDELKPFIHTNVKGNIFIFIEDYNVDKLSFAEQLKEKKNE